MFLSRKRSAQFFALRVNAVGDASPARFQGFPVSKRYLRLRTLHDKEWLQFYQCPLRLKACCDPIKNLAQALLPVLFQAPTEEALQNHQRFRVNLGGCQFQGVPASGINSSDADAPLAVEESGSVVQPLSSRACIRQWALWFRTLFGRDGPSGLVAAVPTQIVRSTQAASLCESAASHDGANRPSTPRPRVRRAAPFQALVMQVTQTVSVVGAVAVVQCASLSSVHLDTNHTLTELRLTHG